MFDRQVPSSLSLSVLSYPLLSLALYHHIFSLTLPLPTLDSLSYPLFSHTPSLLSYPLLCEDDDGGSVFSREELPELEELSWNNVVTFFQYQQFVRALLKGEYGYNIVISRPL